MLEIRRARPDDIPLIYEITKKAFIEYDRELPQGTAPAMIETLEDVRSDFDNKFIFIALSDGQPAGSIRCYPTKSNTFSFSRLGVLPEFRYSSIGTHLVQQAEAAARAHDGEYMFLTTAHRIKKLVIFYRKLGYKIEEVRPAGDYTRVLMGKDIRNSKSSPSEDIAASL